MCFCTHVTRDEAHTAGADANLYGLFITFDKTNDMCAQRRLGSAWASAVRMKTA